MKRLIKWGERFKEDELASNKAELHITPPNPEPPPDEDQNENWAYTDGDD